MGTLIPDPNDGAASGLTNADISFVDGRMFVPTAQEQPTNGVPGEVIVLDDEEVLLICSGGAPLLWHQFAMSGIT